MKSSGFIYYRDMERFFISDLECVVSSERTIDIPFDLFANHEQLLQKLNLVSMYCNSENGTKWFASYLSAFSNKDGMVTKLMTNPMIRLLIVDEVLLNDVKSVLGR